MLNFKNLTVGFDKNILENISGHLPKGSITFLIGPNGSGKTSLLKTLAQIINPKMGIVSASESPIYLSSEFHLQTGLTGNDLLDLYTDPTSQWQEGDLKEIFEVHHLMGVPLDSLSSGERQRMLLLAVLSHKSSVVFFDEPLNHLDWNFSLKLKKLIQMHAEKGRCFLISNHDLNWALNFTDTLTWVLFRKSIFLKNSTESVLNDIKLQEVFRIKTEVITSENRKIISLTEM